MSQGSGMLCDSAEGLADGVLRCCCLGLHMRAVLCHNILVNGMTDIEAIALTSAQYTAWRPCLNWRCQDAGGYRCSWAPALPSWQLLS